MHPYAAALYPAVLKDGAIYRTSGIPWVNYEAVWGENNRNRIIEIVEIIEIIF